MAISNTENLVQLTIPSGVSISTSFDYPNRVNDVSDLVVQETTLTPRIADSINFNQTTDRFTLTGHNLLTGNIVQFNGTAITGFSADTDYYVIRIDANIFQLATSLANAVASPPVPVTTTGSSDVDVTTLIRAGEQPLIRTLELDVDYTATRAPASGLITSVAIKPTSLALSAGKFVAGSTLTIYRETDFKQESNYEPNAIIPADTLESNLDKLTMMAQQLKDDVARSVRFSEAVTDPADVKIPFGAEQRAGKILSFDSAGEFSISQEIGIWRSAWQSGRSYAARDLVFNDTEGATDRYSIYIAKVSHTSDSSTAPLQEGTNWDRVLDASHFADQVELAELAGQTAGGASDLAQDWASKVDGIVDSTDYSAKAYAIGGTGVTSTAGKGAAKEWATKTGGTVDTSEYSAKEYATGTTVTTGSAKAWANTAEDTEVTTGAYSSLHYNAKAQAAKTGAETAQAAAETAQGLAETAQGLAETAQAAAELVYDNFDDRFLGAKATDPSTDNDGDALLTGALYFDTTNNAVKVYNGTGWQNATSSVEGVIATEEYTGDGVEQHFAFTVDQGMELVYLNGVKMLRGTDYECVSSNSSTTGVGDGGAASYIYFSNAPASGDLISIVGFGQSDNSLAVPVSGGTFTGNVAVNGTLTPGTLDVSAGTLTLADDQISGDAIDGGTISDFTSTGIDDNATSTAVTINSSGNVGIGADLPIGRLHVKSDVTTSFYLESAYPTTGKKWIINSRADNGNLQIFNASDSVDAMRIDSSGNVELKSTNAKLILPSGGGIDFSAYGAGTNIDSNLLNDYEEGTWTPKITEGTGGVNTVTTVNSATYTKIGRLVTLFFDIDCSSTSGSAGYLEGIPFDGVAASGNAGIMVERSSSGSSYTFEMIFANSFLIVKNTDSSTIGTIFLTGRQRGSLTYYTA